MSRTLCKNLFASVASLALAFFAFTGAAFASVDLNSADASQLESVKGIGPGLSGKILSERKQGNFKDWSDFETRVSGVGEKNAMSLSRNGLTIGGKAKDGAPLAPDAPKATKAAGRKAPADGTQTIASSAKK